MSQLITVNAGGELTINSGEIACSGNTSVAAVFGAGTIKVTGGTLTTDKSFVLASNGSKTGSTIEVSGGSLTASNAPAIYAPSPEGKTTISGGTITGTTGVEVRAGTLEVTGGTITGTGDYSVTSNGNGSTTSGAGIAISQHTTQKPITVTIGSDGGGTQPTIKGKVGVAVVNPQGNSTTTENLKVDIKGGNISSTETNGIGILSEDKRVTVAGAENASFAASVTVETKKTETVDGKEVTTTTTETKYYTSFSDAMTAVNGNNENDPTITVTLLKNIDVATTISTGKEFTLDLGGKNISQALTIANTTNVSLKNSESTGSITTAITNNGTLTLGGVNVNVSGDNATAVTNTGTLTINNGTATVTGNISLSGASADLTLTAGTITGDLLLDEAAAKACPASKVTFGDSVADTYAPFTANTEITKDNATRFLSYKNNTTDTNYRIGLSGWSSLTSGNATLWHHLDKGTDSNIGTYNVMLDGVASLAADTPVTIDSDNSRKVVGLGKDISVATGDDSIPSASVKSGDSMTAGYKVAIVDTTTSNVASVKTYEDGVTIAEALYGNSVTTVTAAGITDSQIGVYIIGNATVTSIMGGSGADTLTANANNSNLNGGAGNDSINLASGNGATVDVSLGDDTISVASGVTNFSVAGFSTNDVIKLATAVEKLDTVENGIKAGNVTINGLNLSTVGEWTLTKDDASSVASYAQTTLAGATLDATDSLTIGYRDRTTAPASIEIGGVKDTTGFKIGDGAVTLNAAGFTDTVSLKSNAGSYAINLQGNINGDSVTFTGTDGNDTITNAVSKMNIDGGAGNDTISNTAATVTILGGAGADSISNSGASASIDGGAGDDTLINTGGTATIAGGAGNDLFSIGGGTATITDYNAQSDTDTIQFASAPTFEVATGSSDVTFKNGDTTTAVVTGGKGKFITTKVGDSPTVAAYYENASVNSSANTTLVLGANFTGTATASEYKPGDTQVTAVNAATITGDGKVVTLSGFTSITSDNTTNYVITGTPDDAAVSDTSNLVISLGESSSVTVAGAANSTVSLTAGTGANLKVYTASKGVITNATDKFVSLTSNYDTATAYTVAADIQEVSAARITMAGAAVSTNANLNTEGVKITGSKGADTFTLGNGNDTVVMANGLDTVNSYAADNDVIQLTSGAKASVDGSNVVFASGTNGIVVASGKDSKITTTDGTNQTIATYYKDGYVVKDTTILHLYSTANGTINATDNGSGNTTVDASDVSGTAITYNGFTSISGFRDTLDNISGTPTDADTITNGLVIALGTTGSVSVTGDGVNTVSLTADSKNYTAAKGIITDITTANSYSVSLTSNYGDTYTATDTNVVTVTAAGRTTAINITGNDKANVITGGGGNDTLDGGAGNDSLIGGDGADLFIMSAGTDTVKDYGTGNDTIQLATGATVSVDSTSGNVTFGTGEGNSASVMVVEGAKNSFITTKDGTLKTARYYADGAEVIKSGEAGSETYTLYLGSNFKTTTAKASDYTQTGEISVTKVSVTSDVGANAITFNGFDSINGFRANKDNVSVSAAPSDANLGGKELTVTLGTGDATSTVKLNLSADLGNSYVTLTSGTATYQVADGELITGGKATLTNNYDGTSYSLAATAQLTKSMRPNALRLSPSTPTQKLLLSRSRVAVRMTA